MMSIGGFSGMNLLESRQDVEQYMECDEEESSEEESDSEEGDSYDDSHASEEEESDEFSNPLGSEHSTEKTPQSAMRRISSKLQ